MSYHPKSHQKVFWMIKKSISLSACSYGPQPPAMAQVLCLLSMIHSDNLKNPLYDLSQEIDSAELRVRGTLPGAPRKVETQRSASALNFQPLSLSPRDSCCWRVLILCQDSELRSCQGCLCNLDWWPTLRLTSYTNISLWFYTWSLFSASLSFSRRSNKVLQKKKTVIQTAARISLLWHEHGPNACMFFRANSVHKAATNMGLHRVYVCKFTYVTKETVSMTHVLIT